MHPFLTISVIIFIYYTRRHISSDDKSEEIIKRYSTQTPKRYSYSKVKKMTDSFKTKLGQGGFSTVYEGRLPDGREVAVKLLNEFKENGHDFMNEVVSISSTSHINIATLLGFCYQRNKRAFVYEYMPKGSLEKYISTKISYILTLNRTTFCWTLSSAPRSQTLDLQNNAGPEKVTCSMTGVKGTVGFIAPKVVFRNLGNISHKSDVYSYGMLVLEMVGERKSPNERVRESNEQYFPDWIYTNLNGTVIDGGLQWGNTEEEEEMVRKMIIVGLCCIQTLPQERPSMSDVVAMLEGSIDELQIPPKPALFWPPVLPQSSFSLTMYS